jgi:sugar phosphate isomerase/epimerase
VRPQLWVMNAGDNPTDDQEIRVAKEVARLRPIVDAAADIGCTVGLYNHGGWFGEPTNQIAIIKRLARPNLGIVYNLHHGHSHLDQFPQILAAMKPHLIALNLNGMTDKGDQLGKKILPLAQGNRDLEILRTIQSSGWSGPIGILNHTEEDAEARLRDNLEGLEWLSAQLQSKTPGSKPTPRTWKP